MPNIIMNRSGGVMGVYYSLPLPPAPAAIFPRESRAARHAVPTARNVFHILSKYTTG